MRYPNVTVQLTGESDNAFSILGRVSKALKREGVSLAELNLFCEEATSGDYDHLLQTCMEWVNVE